MKPKAIEAPPKDFEAELKTLIPKARTDAKAATKVIELMESNGTADGTAVSFDIVENAEASIVKMYGGGDELLRKLARRRLKMMKAELAGENPTPLESLLAHRIAFCWHHVYLCEIVIAQNADSLGMKQLEFQEKRLDGAHKRYLGAIKALAQVRRLQLPAIQMNIGEKQVNVGTLNGAANGKLLD